MFYQQILIINTLSVIPTYQVMEANAIIWQKSTCSGRKMMPYQNGIQIFIPSLNIKMTGTFEMPRHFAKHISIYQSS